MPPPGSWHVQPCPEAQDEIGGFSADAQAAMNRDPAYFVWWYTAKSVALCASLVVIGFLVGRRTGEHR